MWGDGSCCFFLFSLCIQPFNIGTTTLVPTHRYYRYYPESQTFEEMGPSRARRYVQLAAGTLTIAFLLGAVATYTLEQSMGVEEWPSVRMALSKQEGTIDSLQSVIISLRAQLQNEAMSSANPTRSAAERAEQLSKIDQLDSLFQELHSAVETYDVAFSEVKNIGVDQAFAAPIMQQRVPDLNKRIDWLWQVYWGTAIIILVSGVGLYVTLVRTGDSLSDRTTVQGC